MKLAQALGSWAARQTVLPLPPRPVGFPAPATKVTAVAKRLYMMLTLSCSPCLCLYPYLTDVAVPHNSGSDRSMFPVQARTQKPAPRPPQDADAAWRYRFRRKWRREQLRAWIGTSGTRSTITPSRVLLPS